MGRSGPRPSGWAKPGPKPKMHGKISSAEAVRRWRKNHPRRHFYSQIKHLYGLTPEQYESMLLEQDGRCWLCGTPADPIRGLDVDHDHRTDRVRRLLCSACNRMLGHARDSVALLRKAADYLEDYGHSV